MAKNKITLEFAGFKEYAEKLDKMGGDLKKVTEQALQESHDFVTPNLHKDMKRHRQTGETEKSIMDDAHVQWEGSVASVDVGFDIANGGLPSIFLMYGTPRMKKDSKLYGDVYGAKTKKQIKEIQEQVFAKAIQRIGG